MMNASALITGGGIRIGRAITTELVQAGYHVHVHVNRSADAALELEAELRDQKLLKEGQRFVIHQADLSHEGGQEKLVGEVKEATPSLDVLVNNAALFERKDFDSISRADFKTMYAVNAEAPFFLTQGLLPLLRHPDSANVIFIGDITGDRPDPLMSHYCMTKAAIMNLTRSLAIELAPHIRVNGIAPGPVAFPEDYLSAERNELLQRTPLGREGTTNDIAHAVHFFLQNNYITGQVVCIDGGRSALQ